MGAARKRRGVTLIELVLVISTVAVLVSLSSMYIREIFRLWDFVSFRNEVVAQGRTAMMRMAREMRQVNNQSCVLYANSTCLRFVDAANATVEYSLNGTDLMRNANVMAAGLSGLSFVYYDNQSQVIAAPKVSPQNTDIACVNATMGLQSGSQVKSFNIRVCPRNLGG